VELKNEGITVSSNIMNGISNSALSKRRFRLTILRISQATMATVIPISDIDFEKGAAKTTAHMHHLITVSQNRSKLFQPNVSPAFIPSKPARINHSKPQAQSHHTYK